MDNKLITIIKLFIAFILIDIICISSASEGSRVCDSREAKANIAAGCVAPRYCMFANPDNCNTYIQCQDNGLNAPIQNVMQCPNGHNGQLEWNDNTFSCQQRPNSTCRESRCNTVVETNNGRIRGCSQLVSDIDVNNVRVYSFKGIPYAEPPTGRRRFAKTVPKSNWNGVLNAKNYRSPCITQIIGDFAPQSEDCLFLNIWTPSVRPSSRLPVLFWIHGGGFFWGSGSTTTYTNVLFNGTDNIYDGRQLAARGVVVVTINYRLGVFGFFYGNNSEAPGNQGMWDQVEAIQWVRRNIYAFGGDLDQITLFGESAGSFSSTMHSYSPISRNLFKNAILQSGAPYQSPLVVQKDLYYTGMQTYATTNTFFTTGACSDVNTIVDCLRNKSADELLISQMRIMNWNYDISVIVQGVVFLPIYGEEFHPLNSAQMVKTGQLRTNITFLIGHTDMELIGFYRNWAKFLGHQSRYEPLNPTLPDLNRETYRNDINGSFLGLPFSADVADNYTNGFPEVLSPNDNRIRIAVANAFGDFVVTCTTILFGAAATGLPSFTGRVYQYKDTYIYSRSISKGSVWGGVDHTEELPFVFGLPFSQSDDWNWTDDDRGFSNTVMNIWTYFAKTGRVPRVNGNYWPPYTRRADGNVSINYLELNADNRLGRVYYDRYRGNDGNFPPVINNCEYWDQVLSPLFG